MKRRSFLKFLGLAPVVAKADLPSKPSYYGVAHQAGAGSTGAVECFPAPTDWLRADGVDLSKEEAISILSSCQYKTGYENGWPHVWIYWKDKWWDLGYTTLSDDVDTGIGLPEQGWFKADPIGHFKSKVQYGARLRGSSFSVVRGVSDG